MRSLLFVPGDSARKLDKGLGAGADVLLIDLEDSVALAGKDAARRIAAAFLAASAARGRPAAPLRPRQRPYDRAHRRRSRRGHAGGARRHHAAEDRRRRGRVASRRKLAVREAEYGLDGRRHPHHRHRDRERRAACSRSARLPARAIASRASPGAARISPADLGAEANRGRGRRSTPTPTGSPAPSRCSRAAAAEVDAIDTVYTNFRDLDGLGAECREARRDGFAAKMAIHPAQVPVINEAFTPSAEALAHARAVVDAFAQNPDAGVVGIDGEMIDRPHLRQAERVLARAAATRR